MRVAPQITVPETEASDLPNLKNLPHLTLRCFVSQRDRIVRAVLYNENGAFSVDIVPAVALTINRGVKTSVR